MRGPNPSEYVSTRMPISRASTRCPASWAAIRSPSPTMATTMAMKRESISDAPTRRRNYVVLRRDGGPMRRMLFLCALLSACTSHHEVTKVDDAGLSRLSENQMRPVDDARVEVGRAQDAVARAKAGEADARAQLEVARSDRDVAIAQLKRAMAERDLLKK